MLLCSIILNVPFVSNQKVFLLVMIGLLPIHVSTNKRHSAPLSRYKAYASQAVCNEFLTIVLLSCVASLYLYLTINRSASYNIRNSFELKYTSHSPTLLSMSYSLSCYFLALKENVSHIAIFKIRFHFQIKIMF